MVIVVATEGQTPDAATAITVVAGVEPMLQASASGSQAMLSSAWNVGGVVARAAAEKHPSRALDVNARKNAFPGCAPFLRKTPHQAGKQHRRG